MTHGTFIWTDLSTYDMAAAKADYTALFGWEFQGDGTYDFAFAGGSEVAAVFPMPEFLAKIDMPSFWMSYVHVPDLEASVAKARAHDGVIIEVEPMAFSEEARVALVRDPSGAGITLYEGPEIAAPLQGHDVVAERYHHLPDIGLIAPFYEDLLGWRFVRAAQSPWPVYEIQLPDGTAVAWAEEVSEEIRGKFRYWMPCFTVTYLDAALAKLTDLGGAPTADLQDGRVQVADRQGAHFIVREG